MKRSPVKLRTRLLPPMLMVMIPVFGDIGYTAIREHRQLTQDARAKAMILVQLAANEQSRLIEATKQLLHD